MMNRDEYKNQVNQFCEKNNTLTAKEIYQAATLRAQEETCAENEKQYETEKAKGSVKKESFWKHTWTRYCSFSVVWQAVIALVCFLFVGATAYAGGKLATNIFRDVFGDEVTGNIAAQGYLYELNLSKSDGIFRTDLLAVSGDQDNPQLVFDVYIDDEQLAAENEKIRLWAYTLGVEQYENQLDKYGAFYAFGVRDAEVPNLYHVLFRGAPAWMTVGKEVVVAVCRIDTNVGEGQQCKMHDVNIEFRFTPPADKYHPVNYKYPGSKVTCGDITYTVNRVAYGQYHTTVSLAFDYTGTGESKYEVEDALQAEWEKLIADAKLVVDGTEYPVKKGEWGYVWLDDQGEAGVVNRCYVHPDFPSIDYPNAKSIQLIIGGVTVKIQ